MITGGLVILALIILGAFILYLGHIGMTNRMGVNWAHGVALVGFLFPPVWLFLVPFAPAGWALWRQYRRNLRAVRRASAPDHERAGR